MVALVNADVLKLRRKRGLWYTTLALGAVVVVIIGCLGAIIDSFDVRGGTPFAHDASGIARFFVAILAAIVGARLGSDEHTLNTFRYQVLSGRSRIDLYLSKVGALIVTISLATLAAVVAIAVMSFVPPPDGAPTITLSAIGVAFGQIWLPGIVYGIISLGVGALIRSTGGAIALSLVLQLLGVNLIALLTLITDALKYVVLPTALDRLTTNSLDPDDDLYVQVLPAILIVTAWVALFLFLGLSRTLRSED